ncbi:hypothetical protein WR25_13887 [Diploscapter pachys]|uniref:F-box domain-containing protein n=1 Tax=Diploscapter pachys TaxID=2018661 RepID=A0A2A2JBZ3_9BILA|nr:hypothetical protein WR25_13887 [Diploscapter pachys]
MTPTVPSSRLLSLPAELTRHVASFLPLDDVLNLQESDNQLGALLDNTYWRDFTELTAYSDQDGTYLSVGTSSSSMCKSSCSMSIIPKLNRLRSIRFVRTAESPAADQLADALAQQNFTHLQQLLISIQAYEDDIPHKALCRFIQKVRRLVTSQPSIKHLEVKADFESCVSMSLLNSCQAMLNYNQKPSLQAHTRIIYPLFHSFVEDRSICGLSLFVHCLHPLDLSLQSAFQTALPCHMRSKLSVLRLDFGFDIQSIPFAQLCEVFSKISPYLAMTTNLKQLIVNLPNAHFDSQHSENNIWVELERCILSESASNRIAFVGPRLDQPHVSCVRCT